MKRKKQIKNIIHNNMSVLKMVHKASPSRLPLYFIIILLDVVESLTYIYKVQYVINSFQEEISFTEIVTVYILLSALLLFINCVNRLYNEIYLPGSNQKINQYIQKKLFYKVTSVELACFEDPAFFDKYVKAMSEASGRAGQILDSIGRILINILYISSLIFLFIQMDPFLILFALIPLIIIYATRKRTNQLNFDYEMQIKEKNRKKDYVFRVFYSADFAKEMRLTKLSRLLFENFTSSIKELNVTIKKYGIKIFIMEHLVGSLCDVIIPMSSIIYAAFRTVVSKTMLYGDFVTVFYRLSEITQSLRQLIDISFQFQNHSLYIDNLNYFLDYNPTIHENMNGLDVIEVKQGLTLNNVSFKYKGADSETLKNISITIERGEKIALVGHNGSGKTTLVKLLMRLYDATSGEILLDNKPISEYKLDSYRKIFGTVFQDFKVFSFSVMENIMLKDNITETEKNIAVEAMKNSGIYEKIETLPKTVDTILTREFDDNGVVLSGGEYQKIAIARVFAKPCEIVILDEPSSVLDPIAEYNIFETMMKVCRGKTVIFISHRLSSAVLADRVYMLDNGEIIESGTHTQLIHKKGKYADMWEKQASKYKSNDDEVVI